MKTTFKVWVSIFGLGLVILLGLHLFLQFGLTKTMRDVVLPRIEAETGIRVEVGRLSLNVPNGTLYLKDVELRNPEGFLLENMVSIDRINVEVAVLSLLKQKPIRVKNIEVENALVNVIRNKDGEVNMSHRKEKPPEPPPGGEPSKSPSAEAVLPELLIEALHCNAKVRYLDFKIDELDLVLELGLAGSNLSTCKDPAAAWGELSLTGSLGSQRTRFVTDLKLRLAPVVDPETASFDLTGKVLEIDPRILAKVYSDLGIRSAPFALDPQIHCRKGLFSDSAITLNITDIVLEDKLADRVGGMASIKGLRFNVPIEGSLQDPEVDVRKVLRSALGGNSQLLLSAAARGAIAKELGLEEPPENLADAAIAVLAEQVDEIAESETIKEVLKDLAGGESSDTNAPSPISSDTLIDILGEQVDEIGENEELKGELKNLGKWLFGE